MTMTAMRGPSKSRTPPPIGESPVMARAHEADLRDLRFRSLIADEDWTTLSPAIRRRFTKRLQPGTSAVFVGTVIETRMSRLGWVLAQAARLIGGPLPTSRAKCLASVVSVTEDRSGAGRSGRGSMRGRTDFPRPSIRPSASPGPPASKSMWAAVSA